MGPRRTALALLLVAAACGDPARSTPAIDPGVVQLETDKLAVLTGPVGEERWRSHATYALVEARNQGEQDLMVTLGGELVDPDGSARWPLRRESLRVPAGGTRLFALIDERRAERTAKSARVEVMGAIAVTYPPPFIITDGRVVMDQDRAVAAGYVVNTAERPGSVAVVGAFFDEAGAPLRRNSTLFRLAAEARRGVQLVGPPGSRSAYLFVGDINY